MISGCGRSAGAVIPALGSGRHSPGPNIVLPSWLKGSDPNCTINVFWGQPGALATVSKLLNLQQKIYKTSSKILILKEDETGTVCTDCTATPRRERLRRCQCALT